MPWQLLLMVTILAALLVFGLVAEVRGKGIHSCCDKALTPKANPRTAKRDSRAGMG